VVDEAAEAAAAVAATPIMAEVVAVGMAGTIAIQAVHLRLDLARWAATSAASAARMGTGHAIAAPN
jgi:hypothetical protein